MKLLLLGILFILIAHLCFYIKNTDKVIFNKLKDIFFCKEVIIPIAYLIYRVLPDFIGIGIVSLYSFDKIIIFILLITIFFNSVNIEIKGKRIKINIFTFIFIFLLNIVYEYFYDIKIYFLVLLLLTLINILLIWRNKKDVSLKYSFVFTILFLIFTCLNEYKDDLKLSKKQNINNFYIKKGESDFDNFYPSLIIKDNIIKTNRFGIKFNGTIKKRDYLIQKYKDGKFEENIIYYNNIKNNSYQYSEKIKFIKILASTKEIVTEEKYDKYIRKNKNLLNLLNEINLRKRKEDAGFSFVDKFYALPSEDVARIEYEVFPKNNEWITEKDIIKYAEKMRYFNELISKKTLTLLELKQLDKYNFLSVIESNSNFEKLSEKEKEKLLMEEKKILDKENIIKFLIVRSRIINKIISDRLKRRDYLNRS